MVILYCMLKAIIIIYNIYYIEVSTKSSRGTKFQLLKISTIKNQYQCYNNIWHLKE